ncbi:YybH family protein [Actinomycetospora termitidis]|uniref:Nuclear transport factor 2 family protein n=1 Tax=Actinomycetospora termitidis TaxID=3053470 RepID=A0ABT7M3G9_9PSEU|nr:nuclear transport factor 2 family protein [Actinomycetospora sp. Odt1-22]MDL5155211.1 nuclear transport factor 2 family protein [Actinomycetospora sp. Odt1-22]
MSTHEILAVLSEQHEAIAAGDAERAIATYAPQPVVYSLAPPLVQHTPDGDAAGLAEWIASFTAPPKLAHHDPEVHVSGDLALVHTLTSMSGDKGGEFTLWFRSTIGLRRIDGRWLVVHQHESVPFHMDGSFRAAVELEPAVIV